MPQQDTFQEAMERFDDARDAWRENYERMRRDSEFSNPADPKQWDEKTLKLRKGRVTLTLDHTNQYIQQVVNDARQNTPSLSVVPGDHTGTVEVALERTKRLRQIEYASRAAIAYDTSIEHSARLGLGWLRVVPKLIDAANNYQEPRILVAHDPLACMIDGNSVEYDGSDALFGWVESTYGLAQFKRTWPGKSEVSAQSARPGWCDEKTVRVAEYFSVEIQRGNLIKTSDPEGKSVVEMTEDEYWQVAGKTGVKPRVVSTNPHAELGRTVKWCHVNGVEILDETEFPSKWIGLIPVYGHLLWVDGKRYVCGLTHRLADGQRFHNYQMSALAEFLLEQPKAPFMAPARAIEGYEKNWKELADGNPAYLPYNDLDLTDGMPDEQRPIASPQRMPPPQFPGAFAQAAQMGVQEMQASVGMHKSNLGQSSNAVSGRAKVADKIEGDTATYHYVDNQRRSLEHLGRVLLDMDTRLSDTRRTVRTLGMDDKPGTIIIDPGMREPMRRDQRGKVEAINPTIGEYDVRVKVGPGYTTVREELKERLTTLGQANPQLAAALAPLLVKLDDLPEADKIMRVCLALLPPQVQQAYSDDEGAEAIPPAAQAQLQALQGQLQQAGQVLEQMQQQLQEARGQASDTAIKAGELKIKGYEAQTKRMTAEADLVRANAEAAQKLTIDEVMQALQKTRDDVAAVLADGPQPEFPNA